MLSVQTEDEPNHILDGGKEYTIQVVIDERGLDDAIGIELVTTRQNKNDEQKIYSVEQFQVVKREGNIFTFQLKHKMENAGMFKTAFRMYPKNADLPHRQDFCYVRWFN